MHHPALITNLFVCVCVCACFQVVSSWFGAVIPRRAVWLRSGVRCCLASYSWYHGVVLQEGSG